MSLDQFIFALTDIDDAFVTEYPSYQAKEKRSIWLLKRFAAATACAAIVVCCFWFGRANLEDWKGGDQIDFESYDQFCEMLPDGHLMEYLPDTDAADIACKGIIKYDATDYLCYEEYWYLYVSIQYGNLGGLGIHHTRDYWKTADQATDINQSIFPKENSFTITIAGYDILFMYKQYPEEESLHWLAQFSDGDDLYNVTTLAPDNELLVAFLSAWLEAAE